jgi:hypothetical protein
VKNLEFSLGVGEGLTPASNGLVFKMIVGYTFDVACGAQRDAAALHRRVGPRGM